MLAWLSRRGRHIFCFLWRQWQECRRSWWNMIILRCALGGVEAMGRLTRWREQGVGGDGE